MGANGSTGCCTNRFSNFFAIATLRGIMEKLLEMSHMTRCNEFGSRKFIEKSVYRLHVKRWDELLKLRKEDSNQSGY